MTTNDEDQDWLDALAGKPSPNADPAVTSRATLLHHAIKKRDAELGVNNFDVESELQKLKLRLHSEGLLKGEPASLKELLRQLIEAVSAKLNNRIVRFVVAMSVIFATIMTLLQPTLLVQTTVTRGSSKQIVMAPNPEARLQQLTSEMDRLGIKYQIERKEGKLILKATNIDPEKDDIAEFLERNHITPPIGTNIVLEIRYLSKP